MKGSWAGVPPRQELVEVALGRALARTTSASRALGGLQPATGALVVSDSQCGEGLLAVSGRGGASAGEGEEVVSPEVLGDTVGRPGGAKRVAELALGGAVEAFEAVGCCRDPFVVEAVEEVAAVAFGDTGNVIDEVPVGGTQAYARGLLLKASQESS